MLPSDYKARKETPITTGVLDYFPDALAAVARVSKVGNDQHNPGQPLHWSKDKSNDHADCITRHLLDRGTLDSDGQRHSAKVAWRALALLQIELETDDDGHISREMAEALDSHARGLAALRTMDPALLRGIHDAAEVDCE